MALFIQPNSRQIPSSTDYTAHPLYNDLIYGYLQSISKPGKDGVRYVSASDATRTKISQALGISSPTVKKYFEGMQEMLLIGPKNKGVYELTFIAEDYAYLVPQNVLEKIIARKTVRTLSIYIWACSLGWKGQFTYLLSTVKSYIGLSTATADNAHIVTESLDILQELGLLKHGTKTELDNGQYRSKKFICDVVNS